MEKLTLLEAIENGLSWYYVSRGGSIKKCSPSKSSINLEHDKWVNDESVHLTKNGTIDIRWGYALFANAEDAAKLAKKIATTKYVNSLNKIKKVTKLQNV